MIVKVEIAATFPDGQVVTRTIDLEQPNAKPEILSVDPVPAVPGQPLTLTGTNFQAGATVTIDGKPAMVVSDEPPTKLVVRVPA